MHAILEFLKNEDGPTAVEYAVMLAMILLVLIVTIVSFGQAQNAYWGGIKNDLQANGF